MDLSAVEECLQTATERSSVWALLKEDQVQAWVLVLSDESLVDVALDPQGQYLELRAELGLVADPQQRANINELVLQCNGVIPMPLISLGQDHRYEALSRWRVDPGDSDGLVALLEDLTEQVQLWRDVVAKPMANAASAPAVSASAPAFGMFA